LTKTYYIAGGQLIATQKMTNTTEAGILTYLHSDHLGSTSTTTCGNSACGAVGAVLTRQSYCPYGSIRTQTGAPPTDIGFTAQRNDAGIGLMDFRARAYSPTLGRFISADSIVPGAGNPQSLNRYSYVLNAPLKYTDPTGHYSEEEIMKFLGVDKWDEVKAFFEKGGALEGRWGWLEVLRQARDGDVLNFSFWSSAEGRTIFGSGEFQNGMVFNDFLGMELPLLAAGTMGDSFEVWRPSFLFSGRQDLVFATEASTRYYHAGIDINRIDGVALTLDILSVGANLLLIDTLTDSASAAYKVSKNVSKASSLYGAVSGVSTEFRDSDSLTVKLDYFGAGLSTASIVTPPGPSALISGVNVLLDLAHMIDLER
jgi:RHS repeat-associated protein